MRAEEKHVLKYGGRYTGGVSPAECSCGAHSKCSFERMSQRKIWHELHLENLRRIQAQKGKSASSPAAPARRRRSLMADLKRYAVEADIEAFDKYDILMKPDADGRWASWEEAASIIAELERQLADARELARCQVCGIKVFWWPRYSGDPEAYDMAHIKSRGAGGSDTLDNVRCLCHRCHMKEHGEGKKSA